MANKKERKKEIVMRGYVISQYLQSEGAWEIRIETTNLKELALYDAFIEALKLTLTQIDDMWSGKATERNLRMQDQFIREKTEEKNTSDKTRITKNYIQFNVLPQAISNSIKYVRKMTYEIINKYALKIPLEEIEGGARGNRMKYWYMVPKSLFPELKKDIDGLNRFVYELNYVRGKKTQKIIEGEEGKLSLKDYYSSPYFERLKNLVIAMGTLQKLGYHAEFKNLLPSMKQKILTAIQEGGDLKPILYGEQYAWIERAYQNAKREFEGSIPHKILEVSINKMIVDMSPSKIREWVEEDPEMEADLRRQAHDYISGMVKQFGNEIHQILEQLRKKAKTYIKAGAGARLGKELDDLGKKIMAMGIEIPELENLATALKSKTELEEEEIYNLTNSLGYAVENIVENIGVELGEELEEISVGSGAGEGIEEVRDGDVEIEDEDEMEI